MKLTVMWRANKHTPKKRRIRQKPKIRWQQLGLAEPTEGQLSLSMAEIRRQVVMMSNQGLGQGVRSLSGARGARGTGGAAEADPSRKRRRGATE